MATAGTQQAGSAGKLNVRAPEPINGPFREVQLSEQIKSIGRAPGWQAGRHSKTLVKHPDLRVVLTALKAHAYVHEHRAAGSITVQTLEGHVRMHIPGRTFDLPAGRMVMLEEAVPHDVEALKDSVYLLTIAWHETLAGHGDAARIPRTPAYSQPRAMALRAQARNVGMENTASASPVERPAGAIDAAA